MRFTEKTARRAVRTFFQAAAAYALVSLKNGVDFTSRKAVYAFITGLIAAALAALMNLEAPGERGGGAMSLSDFVRRYLGRATDYDGIYGPQCVDLAKMYIDKVLGVKPKSIGNAHAYFDDFESTYLKKYFRKIPYQSGVQAEKGDLVVWGKYYNGKSKYGHIAIATGVQDGSSITTYDQNWNGAEMKRVKHSLTGIAGFLRPVNNEKAKAQFFPACARRFASVSDALESIGADSTYAFRKKIAAVNGIQAYTGTAAQNIRLLTLLKTGKLLRP